ncbi:MarR family winged helix-turn-helix transcriptional regulator [Listeria newyorkensis]|uniref:MarR family transcriptional regulator n=1 Tax=Listeria newyorkensis TaxID=1497681 RepID=A0A841Z0B8_9LIST|nr:MarR family transcriptional regulator [Listeria newyorkensis]MBC1458592.1 MarR family transcriptional regulator [Listeria newyorkensis]
MRDFYDDITFRTNVVARKASLGLQHGLERFDVTPEQWSVLNVVDQKAPISQRHVAELVEKDAPTVNRIMDVLVRKNLLEKVVDKKDRRITLLSLTMEGKQKVQLIRNVVEETCSHFYQGISDAELGVYLDVLARIENNLE